MNFLFGCIKEITYICINNRQIQATTLHIHYYIYICESACPNHLHYYDNKRTNKINP